MVCPVVVWLESVDICMQRLKEAGAEFGRVLGVSGAAQQHGSVYWNSRATSLLASLDPAKSLEDQLEDALSLPHAPLWQDSSTTAECRALEAEVGGPQNLADTTGSRAYERFTGPQIKRLFDYQPDDYANTSYISLISSFVASIFLGKIAPIEIADASGMNLMNIETGKWDEKLLKACGGDSLRGKLGGEPVSGGTVLGTVSKYWVERYGFNEDCIVAPFTGDNPSSIVSLSNPGDAILSLGTSTTLLVSIPPSDSHPVYMTTSHILAHPTTPGGYIAMLCYKNGDLARKAIRDRHYSGDWAAFDESIQKSPPGNDGYLEFYFLHKEIIPDGVIGEYAFKNGKLLAENDTALTSSGAASYARAVCESQLLSIKSRLAHILPHASEPLHRCIVTGGASNNLTILQMVADVLNMPVYIATTSASATLGGALLAKYAWWKQARDAPEASFEEMRKESTGSGKDLKKVVDPREGVTKIYDALLDPYQECEDIVISMNQSSTDS
ncbi:hypothetical protein FRC02_002726 [Tulasnella sp. 418]|nr:hypothetical protein FRC02_002726 [Tulasnella sp. 418]